jgi:hypothetical protein
VRGDHPSWATDRDTEASDRSAPGARGEAGRAGSPDRSAVARRPPHGLERCGRGRVAPGHGVAQRSAAVGRATVPRAGQERPRPATGPRGPGRMRLFPRGRGRGGSGAARAGSSARTRCGRLQRRPGAAHRRAAGPPPAGSPSPCRGRQGLTRQPGALPIRHSPSAPCRSSRPLPSGAVAGLLSVPPVLRLPSGGHSERSRPAGSGHRGKPGALDQVAPTQPQKRRRNWRPGSAPPRGPRVPRPGSPRISLRRARPPRRQGLHPPPSRGRPGTPGDHAPGGAPVSAGRRRW